MKRTNKQTKTVMGSLKRHPNLKKSYLGVKYSPVQLFDWESIFSLHFQKITYDPITGKQRFRSLGRSLRIFISFCPAIVYKYIIIIIWPNFWETHTSVDLICEQVICERYSFYFFISKKSYSIKSQYSPYILQENSCCRV